MVTLVRANNPSPMTLTGTNSYVVDCGAGEALVIDPGPRLPAHIAALIETAAAKSLRIRAIAVTHGHPDHAPGAADLAAATRALVFAHPRSRIKRDADLPLGGELRAGTTALTVMDAPGHAADHAVFYLPAERILFTGDVIVGEGTVVISPPGGEMRDYQRTLALLLERFGDAAAIYGGHGPIVTDARAKIQEYISHRELRERQVLDALREGPMTILDIVRRVYGPKRSVLWPVMARQMLAHLQALEAEGRVSAPFASPEATAEEIAILNPSLEELVGPEEAAVLAAELGTELRIDALPAYRLVPGAEPGS